MLAPFSMPEKDGLTPHWRYLLAKKPPVPVPAGYKYCFGCSKPLPLEDFHRLRAGDETRASRCAVCEKVAKVERLHAKRRKLEERAAAIRDDIWAAMKRGRSTRALQAVKAKPQGNHRIRVKDTPGFISIGELVCRHAEREACRRAAKLCKTFEAAADAVRFLERGTPTFERTQQMKEAWRTLPPPRPIEALQHPDCEPEDDNDDAFGEAFGDWAPAWMLAA